MPVDELGEVVVAAIEVVGEAVLDDSGRGRRSRFRRVLSWSLVVLVVGLLLVGGWLAFG